MEQYRFWIGATVVSSNEAQGGVEGVTYKMNEDCFSVLIPGVL